MADFAVKYNHKNNNSELASVAVRDKAPNDIFKAGAAYKESNMSGHETYGCRKRLSKSSIGKLSFYKSFLLKRLPILNWLPNYKLEFLLPDAISGIQLRKMNIYFILNDLNLKFCK